MFHGRHHGITLELVRLKMCDFLYRNDSHWNSLRLGLALLWRLYVENLKEEPCFGCAFHLGLPQTVCFQCFKTNKLRGTHSYCNARSCIAGFLKTQLACLFHCFLHQAMPFCKFKPQSRKSKPFDKAEHPCPQHPSTLTLRIIVPKQRSS